MWECSFLLTFLSEVSESYSKYTFNFIKKNHHTVFKMVMPSANSPININVVIVLHPQQQFISYVFYLLDNFSHFSRFVISYYGFNLNFSVIKNVEHSFMCLFVNCISSFLKSLCKSFTDFLSCCLFSYYWAVRFLFYFLFPIIYHI